MFRMSSVIKAFSAQRLRDGGTFNFEDLTIRAGSYLDEVRAQATALLAKAQQEAIEIRQRAEQEGRQAALRTAEAQLDERIGKQMTSLLPASTKRCRESLKLDKHGSPIRKQTIVKVATAIAARIVHARCQAQPEITLTLVAKRWRWRPAAPTFRSG